MNVQARQLYLILDAGYSEYEDSRPYFVAEVNMEFIEDLFAHVEDVKEFADAQMKKSRGIYKVVVWEAFGGEWIDGHYLMNDVEDAVLTDLLTGETWEDDSLHNTPWFDEASIALFTGKDLLKLGEDPLEGNEITTTLDMTEFHPDKDIVFSAVVKHAEVAIEVLLKMDELLQIKTRKDADAALLRR